MFDTYFVRGDVVATDLEKGNVYAFKSIYELTIRDYQADWIKLRSMLDLDIPIEKQNLFWQQQLVSAFSLLENFLSCTFLRETCDREDAYHRVWASGCLDKHIKGSVQKAIKNGPDCIQKELLYIEAVNRIIYHNPAHVRNIFKDAFGIDVQLESLGSELQKRHDIVHRFGYNKSAEQVLVTKEEVHSLLESIKNNTKDISERVLLIPQMPD